MNVKKRYFAALIWGLAYLTNPHAQTIKPQNDETIAYLSNPKLSQQQIVFLKETSRDPYLDAKTASFFGKTSMRFSSLEHDAQLCMIAQYMTYQDITRSNWKPETKAFAKDNLKKDDWCYGILKSMNLTVPQVMSYDGLITLYYVLARDMELRIKLFESK